MTGTLSYIIPFRNSRDTITDALDSVFKDGSASEVILVDDGSTDETNKLIEEYIKSGKNIKYIRNPESRGAALSRNIGAGAAKGDILVFLDSDIVIPKGTGNKIEGYFAGDKISPVPDAIVANRARECLCRNAASMYKNYWTSFNFSRLKGWTPFLCSSFFAIKKEAFKDVGGFRDIKHAEDNDLGYRLSAAHHKIYFADDLAVSHKKKFGVLSLLKREFRAGREGIKVKVENGAFGAAIKERKFFAVNKNFIYSLPFAILAAAGLLLSWFYFSAPFLAVSLLSTVAIVLLNRHFLAYSSCSRDYVKGAYYVIIMIAQLNAISLGIVTGILELSTSRFLKIWLVLSAYLGSFARLFVKRPFPPEQITFFVTDRCNLACSHCFVKTNSTDKKDELTVEEIDRITKDIGRVNYVTITGGEPFLREDITDIARVLSRNLKPVFITMITNGYMTDAIIGKVKSMLEDLKGRKFLIKVSIDGPAELHDSIRMRQGSFASAVNTFSRLKSLKCFYKNLSLGIITTYSSRNKGIVDSLFKDVILKLGPDQYGLVLERPGEANRLNESVDVDDYIGLLKDINEKMSGLARGFFRKFRIAYKNRMADKLKEIYSKRRYPVECYAGTLNAVITPLGEVFPCEQLGSSMGSLRQNHYDWKALWRSAEAEKVRDSIKNKGCYCTSECYMPFNLSYNAKELLKVLKNMAGRAR